MSSFSFHYCCFYLSRLSRKNQRDGVVVRVSASQSVDLRLIPQVESYQKTLKNGIHSFPAWRSVHKVWRTSRKACLLCPWARHLTGCLHLHVADRWRGQAIYSSWWPSLTKDMQTNHELVRIIKSRK